MKDGELLVTSAEHKRASTRVSFFALVSFGPRGSLRVAKVESLLRVRELPGDCELGPDGHLVPSPPPAVLRLAVCSVYARQGMQGEMSVVKKDQLEAENHVLSCDRIMAVLAFGEVGKHKPSSASERKAAAEDAKDQDSIFSCG